MKKYLGALVGVLGLVLLGACSSSKASEVASSADMKYKIERIEYFTSGCFGTCPQFKIEIDKDRKAVYTAKRFNMSQDFSAPSPEGVFEGVIDEATYNSILKKLNDMDFPNLQDRYKVDYTDAQTGNLKIIYDGGKEKMITDYGMNGTPELVEIHMVFLDLRGSFSTTK